MLCAAAPTKLPHEAVQDATLAHFASFGPASHAAAGSLTTDYKILWYSSTYFAVLRYYFQIPLCAAQVLQEYYQLMCQNSTESHDVACKACEIDLLGILPLGPRQADCGILACAHHHCKLRITQ